MLFNPIDNRWLYNIVDSTMRMLKPVSEQYLVVAKQINRVADLMNLPGKVPFLADDNESREWMKQNRYYMRFMAGSLYVQHMLLNSYYKPEFGINEVQIDDEYREVNEEIILKKSFCNLLYFRKSIDKTFPKVLLVAPMSGHYATLLRETVADMLPFYDVYITDWKSARDVPITEGAFDLYEYTQYIQDFMEVLGPDLHVMAVCQSTVPVLVALTLMSQDKNPKVPASVILLGGPIDVEQTPTAVDELATSRGDDWFKQNVISIVPSHYAGYMRLVYPGFMQLSGFMSMNIQRHIESLNQAIENFAKDDVEKALKTVKFYIEYFSTMDLTAEFYMQTIDTVFQRKLLTKGRLKMGDRYVNLKEIEKTAILAIEGEKDDITGIGQTKSVLPLCKNLKDSMKKYILAEGVGHYGLFNGSKFRNIILPEIVKFTSGHEKNKRGRENG